MSTLNGEMAPKKETESCKKDLELQAPADFETAIASSGFGLFNYMLLFVAVFAFIASMFETTTVSFILPSAECDLKLTLLDKGTLNAITYAGMITSAVFWGYFADIKGRKRLLALGYLLGGFCVFGASLSQNTIQLMVFKYFGGFIMCGPFAVFMSYLSEIHGKEYRGRILMFAGTIFPIGQLILPVMALTILPEAWDFHILGLDFHSWQVFLALSSMPSLISGICFLLVPESPKFLMSQGRNEEALKVFRMIYAINKRQPEDTYPHKMLIEEVPAKPKKIYTISTVELTGNDLKSRRSSAVHALKGGLAQMRPLLRKPHFKLSILVYFINFCMLLGQNTMRLWLPQLFASLKEFESKYTGTPSMCAIVEYGLNKTALVQSIDDSPCVVVISADSYTNNIVVSVSGIVMYILTGTIINATGPKWIVIIGLIIAGISAIAMFWSVSSLMTVILSSCFVTMGSISSTALINESLNLFPTSLRTMIVSLAMMFGRIGSIIGNVLFPTFMSLGCFPPFLMISLTMFEEHTIEEDTATIPAADFEAAIASSGFGVFNVLLFLVAFFGFASSVFETTTFSYILHSAECDLKLTLLDKGILNGIVYAGMITSAILWGYIADTRGCKKVIVLCSLLDSICVLGSSLSQSAIHLIVLKYFGGFISCGSFPVLMTYLSEVHGKKYRGRVMMFTGMMFSIAGIFLPIMALIILPQEWNIQIIGLSIHSWQVFLAISAVPSLVNGVSMCLLPESPKFLMSQGRNLEALEIFQTIYRLNKRQPRSSFPHKALLEEDFMNKKINEDVIQTWCTKAIQELKSGVAQMLPLLQQQYLKLSLTVYLMSFFILLGQNTMRLWLPQLFSSFKEFEIKSKSASICAIVEDGVIKTQSMRNNSCEIVITAASYTNNIIVSISGIVMYIFAGSFINALGGKWILIIALPISGMSAISMYWSVSSVSTLILACGFVTMGSISFVALLNESVNIFPTSLRTMVVSLTMMFGRTGSVIGNIIFPTLMSLGCIPPFLLISFVMFAALFMSVFLPNTKNASLK